MRERHWMRIEGVHERDLRVGDVVPGIGEVMCVGPERVEYVAAHPSEQRYTVLTVRPHATVMALRPAGVVR